MFNTRILYIVYCIVFVYVCKRFDINDKTYIRNFFTQYIFDNCIKCRLCKNRNW